MSSQGSLNGFSTLPEHDAISVDAHSIAHFSMPEDLLKYHPTPEAVMTRFRNGEVERRIHCNVKLSEDEQKKLASLRSLAKSQQKSLLPSLIASATRYLGRVRGDPKKALADMIATQEWRSKYFKDGPISDESVMKDLATGAIYFTGRDKLLRPTLVVRAARIPNEWAVETGPGDNHLLRVMVFCLEYMLRFMLLPGRVESGVIILDLQDLTFAQVPVNVLKHMLKILSNHYATRISTFYILNMPRALRGPSQLGLRLLTDRQRQKLRVITDLQEMSEEFALHHLECDLGGSRQSITTFFPFALQAGPFDAGCTAGANSRAIADIHTAFTRTGVLGRLWNEDLQAEENTLLEFNRQAASELLYSCGLLEPPRDALESTDGAGDVEVRTSADVDAAVEDDLSLKQDQSHRPTLLQNHAWQPSHEGKTAGFAERRSISSLEGTWEGDEEPISIVNTSTGDCVQIEADEIRPAQSRFCWLPICG